MIRISLVLYISIFINSVYNAHFRGGSITWRPATNASSVLHTQRTIYIDQRYAWSRSAAASSCTSTTITSYGLIGDTTVITLTCQSSPTTCTNVQYTTSISTLVPCTDYNTVLGMSFGHSSTAVNLTVQSYGFVLGYAATGAWLTLQLSSGTWHLMTYINMSPRTDNGLINSSPTSDIPAVVYVPSSTILATSIDIPMSDADGDDIECRFAQSSNILGGVTVNECTAACEASALPVSTQLISGNNTCTLIVTLLSIGYYAVAIQLEDFIVNTTTVLSSVPVQFLILTYDASNPSSACTEPPVIKSIPPDFPSPGATVVIQVTVLYTAMVIAQTGCVNDTDTSITNFITSSPPGMLKTNLPFALASPSFAINLTWTPTADELGNTYTFCATAIDSNYYSSQQYCFNFFVGPKTTTTSTTSTTSSSSSSTSTTSTTSSTSLTSTTSSTTSSTSSTSTTTTSATTTTSTTTTTIITTVTPYNCIPLLLGLGLGLGLPLLLLLSLLALGYLCRWCPGPLRSILRYRFGRRHDMYCQYCKRSTLFDDPRNEHELKSTIPEGTRRYRQQYVKENNDQLLNRPTAPWLESKNFSIRESEFSGSGLSLSGPMSRTVTSLLSPSVNNLPTEDVSRAISPPQIQLQHQGSILLRAYSKQVHPQ